MTTKQYTGLLALICVLGSGFAANQWLRFAKAQHAYQQQLADEKQQILDMLAQQIAKENQENAAKAASVTPLDKAWEQFRRDVTFIRDRDSVSRGNDSHSDIRIWCDRMLGAIQKRNFTLFNYLTHQHQAVEDQPWLVKDLHYPDPKEPGLTPAEIADFSKFIKPETNDKTVQ